MAKVTMHKRQILKCMSSLGETDLQLSCPQRYAEFLFLVDCGVFDDVYIFASQEHLAHETFVYTFTYRSWQDSELMHGTTAATSGRVKILSTALMNRKTTQKAL